jgi:2-aminoadipate transaminase
VDFPYRFSRLAESMRPSPIRELFAMTQRAGMISFAGGLPDPAIFPVDEFAACGDVLLSQGQSVLQYGATEGWRPLVDILCRRMTELLGQEIGPERLVIATGSQQVMDMAARVLLDPGDTVVAEAPTYPGALHTFRSVGARFALVPCDAEGMRVDLLPEVIERARSETGRLPKLVYSIVSFSNPSGASLSPSRRVELVEVARRYGVPVLEDDPYRELRYAGEAAQPAFRSASGEGVIFASSFSKILAPGVRVAWAVAEPSLIRRMVIAKQGMDLCTPVVTQALVAEYCRRGHLDRHLEKIRDHYAAKAAAMAAALRRELPLGAAKWSDPEGGFFFWLQLPGRKAREVFDAAIEEGVAFLPGETCYPGPSETVGEGVDGRAFARLCFTFASSDDIVEGCRRMSRVLTRGSAFGVRGPGGAGES